IRLPVRAGRPKGIAVATKPSQTSRLLQNTGIRQRVVAGNRDSGISRTSAADSFGNRERLTSEFEALRIKCLPNENVPVRAQQVPLCVKGVRIDVIKELFDVSVQSARISTTPVL